MGKRRQSRANDLGSIPPLESLKESCSDPRMRAAIGFLLAHDLAKEFRTEKLSDHLNLSTWRLLHLFHEYFGFSPARALKSRRMRRAMELLPTFMTVKEIMDEVGLNDLSHFVRDFKRMYGLTPSQLRQQIKERKPGRDNGSPSTSKSRARGAA